MKKVYILAAKRSAIGKFQGSLSSYSPGKLGELIVKNIIEENKIQPNLIDEVIVGNVLSAGQMQGVPRQVSIYGNIPVEVPAYGVNMVCGSGMKAVMNAYSNIALGTSNLIIAGGVESMSNSVFMMPSNVRSGVKMGNITM